MNNTKFHASYSYFLTNMTKSFGNAEKQLKAISNEKKCSEQMQTLRAGCSKAEPKIFAPPQTPSRGRGTAKI